MQQQTTTLAANDLEFSALVTEPSEPNGQVVLLVHGFPDTAHTFRNQLGVLAAAGYRAIAPTLRGYEPSSQPPDRDYSLAALAGDVIGWLDDLAVGRAHLIGHDWGAAIAYGVAGHHAGRLRSVTTLALPPVTAIPSVVRRVPRQILRSWYMTWFQTPKLAERSLAAGDLALIRRLWRSWSPGYAVTAEDLTALRDAFGRPGVIDAALAYYRQNATPPQMLGLRQPPHMQPTEMAVPALVINGADDGCMDRRLYPPAIRATEFSCGVTHHQLDGVGHFLHLEAPDRVNALILEHLAST